MPGWLITGSYGQLGRHMTARLAYVPDVVAVDRDDLDICDSAAVDDAIGRQRPDIIVNAAAYTAVDAAESDEQTAYLVNAVGPANLAAAAAEHGARLIHISTDYVFDGQADRPYEPDDVTNPRSAYGRTKLAGERLIHESLPDRSHVVRTAWLYGGPGPNFVDAMRRLESEKDFVDVVDNQVGSPTWVGDLADAVLALAAAVRAPAVLHYTNAGRASWWEFAREVFRLVGADPDRVRKTTSEAFVRPAPRPAWSVLSPAAWIAAGLPAPRPWQEALAECLR